ncbi:hypothetical protein [Aestuariibacter salexigens]|uniref:hypothetical protein n=1 Tax=Aestuariibacter salexigens TaxID=226010 RepID=UPI00042102C5|nr:hypothetical protein [Aestuariibacter salexigens]
MKYNFILPLSALIVVVALNVLIEVGVLPPGLAILENIKQSFGEGFYLLVFLIILLESIIYVGFYFPGQFFAVMLVVLANPDQGDIIALTLCMVGAATLGSAINFLLGRFTSAKKPQQGKASLKQLLLAMIHINSLAFFMFNQGSQRRHPGIIATAGLLNLPYYLALIAGTAVLSEEVMGMAENTWFIAAAISVWLAVAIVLDIKQQRTAID